MAPVGFRERWCAGAALVVCLGLVVALFSTLSWTTLARVLRVTSGGLYLVAGVGFVLVHRIGGRARAALMGIAFLTLGTCAELLPITATLRNDSLPRAALPVWVAVWGIPALALSVRALNMDVVNSVAQPVRAALLTLVVTLGGLLSIRLLDDDHHLVGAPTLWAIVLVGVGVGWGLTAVWVFRRPIRLREAAALTLALVGLSCVFTGCAINGSPLFLVIAAGFGFASGLSAATLATHTVLINVRRLGTSALHLAGELSDTTRVLADEQARREELVHDARSAVASLRLANSTLERFGDEADVALVDEMRAAFDAELQRLAGLLQTRRRSSFEAFDLTATVLPLIRIARDTGSSVRVDMPPTLLVQGIQQDSATVVHTLLSNVALYGGGAVEVRADVRAFDVRLSVTDRGPGIALDERDAIFRRGFRGAASVGSEGSGLGLYVARRLMAAQDGALTVEESSSGGACFVLTLPLARPHELGDDDPLTLTDNAGIPR